MGGPGVGLSPRLGGRRLGCEGGSEVEGDRLGAVTKSNCVTNKELPAAKGIMKSCAELPPARMVACWDLGKDGPLCVRNLVPGFTARQGRLRLNFSPYLSPGLGACVQP